jgi:fatty acid elongase 3
MLADLLLSLPVPRPPTYLASFQPGVTPLSTLPSVATAVAIYLSIVFGIHTYQKDKAPKKLNTLFQIHNVLLSSVSGLLLVLILEEIIPKLWNKGVFYVFCSAEAWTEVSSFRRFGPPC